MSFANWGSLCYPYAGPGLAPDTKVEILPPVNRIQGYRVVTPRTVRLRCITHDHQLIVWIVPDGGCAALKGDAASLRLILFRATASAELY